jgi:hypothetical protein
LTPTLQLDPKAYLTRGKPSSFNLAPYYLQFNIEFYSTQAQKRLSEDRIKEGKENE